MTINETIVDLYRAGKYPSEIAKAVGYSRGSAVVRVLARLGVPLTGTNGYKRNKNSKRYSVNENYFSVIDTEEKAYWLGFLYADGYNTEAYRITINLQWSDREQLERLKVALGSTHPILYRTVKIKKLNEVARLDVNSRQLCEDLKKHGMVKAKSLKLVWPIFLRLDLIRHFVRGYFDGDGCVSFSKSSGVSFAVCSSERFAGGLKAYLIATLSLRDNQLDKAGNARVIRWTGLEPVGRIYQLLYDNSTVYLPRKKSKFESLLGLSSVTF